MPPSIATLIKKLILPLTLILCMVGVARADKVDRLVDQVRRSSDYKVRLSAALSLSKLRDSRAIPAFGRALSDSDKTVRGVAAAGLAKVVNSSTSSALRDKVLAALKRVAAGDSNSFVRKQAQKSYDTVKNLRSSGGGVAVRSGGTYVNIGAMTAQTDDSSTMRKLMKSTTQKTFSKKGSSMLTAWPGGSTPSKGQVSAKKMHAFHVDGTLNSLNVDKAGSTATVSCSVSMLLATFPEKSMFGFLKGGAQVQAGTSSTDIRYAKEDCVAAVMEDLIARKIIPTIQSRNR